MSPKEDKYGRESTFACLLRTVADKWLGLVFRRREVPGYELGVKMAILTEMCW